MLQVGASQYMAALIIGFVNSATIQVLSQLSACPDDRAAHHPTASMRSVNTNWLTLLGCIIAHRGA